MKMIQFTELVDYVCPNCGHTAKAERGQDMECPKCDIKNQEWFADAKHLLKHLARTGCASEQF